MLPVPIPKKNKPSSPASSRFWNSWNGNRNASTPFLSARANVRKIRIASSTCAANNMAEQPEAAGQIRTSMMMGLVFIETVIIYALIVAILIIFVL